MVITKKISIEYTEKKWEGNQSISLQKKKSPKHTKSNNGRNEKQKAIRH